MTKTFTLVVSFAIIFAILALECEGALLYKHYLRQPSSEESVSICSAKVERLILKDKLSKNVPTFFFILQGGTKDQ